MKKSLIILAVFAVVIAACIAAVHCGYATIPHALFGAVQMLGVATIIADEMIREVTSSLKEIESGVKRMSDQNKTLEDNVKTLTDDFHRVNQQVSKLQRTNASRASGTP